jgi:hypothetical protein
MTFMTRTRTRMASSMTVSSMDIVVRFMQYVFWFQFVLYSAQ